MKIMMRIDKTQVKDTYKFAATLTTSVSGWFRAGVPIIVGYTQYDVMCVGGSGGKYPDAGSGSSSNAAWASGSGGGGSVKARGLLADLESEVEYYAGRRGVDYHLVGIPGHPAGPNPGDPSYFGDFMAYGGEPNTYGAASSTSGTPSIGGDGGGNSLGLGTVGIGGHGRGWNFAGDATGTLTNATNGTWEDGAEEGFGGGGGGGGGRGKMKKAGSTWASSTATAGGKGSNPDAAADGGAISGSKGGDGGGANIAMITGVDEYYGGDDQAGVVVIKLT